MTDREKVIKGLECCVRYTFEACEECKYHNECKKGDYYLPLLRDALALLKAQEPVKPKFIDGKRNHFILCRNCNTDLIRGMKFCSYCGKAVKWDDKPGSD